ncbi:MAG: OsmC family protein [Candidatus Aenigmarchaeota archaeon]|nr:OsmC family protein [Candidatus Aenigmarchaeota archaeon]
MNNIDLEKVEKFVKEVSQDRTKAIKEKKIEGIWNFTEGEPQFRAEPEHGQGKTVIEADAPTFLGGSGIRPDPVQYCLYGLAACFAQTFASVAAEKGVELKSLKVAAENRVNLAKSLGLGDEPIVEKAKLTFSASAGDMSRMKEIGEEARERCPGVYCLTNPIKLEIEMKEI